MNIQINRIFLIFALVAAFFPIAMFSFGEHPPIAGNVTTWLTIAGDFLSSQMIGIVISVILFSISRMFSNHS